MGVWQDMRTAPKDGTVLLGWFHNGGIREIWWKEDYEAAYWQDHADSEPDPAYWQPLPAAPGEIRP